VSAVEPLAEWEKELLGDAAVAAAEETPATEEAPAAKKAPAKKADADAEKPAKAPAAKKPAAKKADADAAAE
jgi:small subunit ribosomal protein S2